MNQYDAPKANLRSNFLVFPVCVEYNTDTCVNEPSFWSTSYFISNLRLPEWTLDSWEFSVQYILLSTENLRIATALSVISSQPAHFDSNNEAAGSAECTRRKPHVWAQEDLDHFHLKWAKRRCALMWHLSTYVLCSWLSVPTDNLLLLLYSRSVVFNSKTTQ